MYIYLNDRIVPQSEAVVSVFDHGFLYGDGIYETMRAYDGVVFMLEEHLRRLYRSASMIGLELPGGGGGDMDFIRRAVYETLSEGDLKRAYLRLTVTRGKGPIGLDPDLCKKPTFLIMAERFKEYPKAFYENGVRVIIAETRRNIPQALDPRIKSLNFLNNIISKIEAKRAEAYEALMLNAGGMLAEGTISNVFFVRDDVLCTPSVECGILDGITRGVTLELATKEGLTVKEGEFTKEDIYGAQEVFITNTTLEVMPVSRVDDRSYGVGGITKLLHRAYKHEVRSHVSDIKASGPSLWGYNE